MSFVGLGTSSFPNAGVALKFRGLVASFVLSTGFYTSRSGSAILVPSKLCYGALLVFFFYSSRQGSLFTSDGVSNVFGCDGSLMMLQPTLRVATFTPRCVHTKLACRSGVFARSFSSGC